MEMVSFVLSFVLYLLIVSPICLMLHELGHAAMILLLTRQGAVFTFGSRGPGRTSKMGRITTVLHPDARALFFCRYRLEDYKQLTQQQDVWITLGGPLSSLLFTLVFAVPWLLGSSEDPWSGLTIISLFNLVISAVPGYYPRWLTAPDRVANDGLQIVQLLRNRAA